MGTQKHIACGFIFGCIHFYNILLHVERNREEELQPPGKELILSVLMIHYEDSTKPIKTREQWPSKENYWREFGVLRRWQTQEGLKTF